MKSKIIVFPENRNKAIINTEILYPELREQIINFAGHMYRNNSTSEDCYAHVEMIGWGDDKYTLTENGINYLKSIVKPYLTEEENNSITYIDIEPENTDNIYDICGLYVKTDKNTYNFRANYCMPEEPIDFRRVHTKEEENLIYPNLEKYKKLFHECLELATPINDENKNNPLYNKMQKAFQDKINEYFDKSWEMDEKALEEVHKNIPNEVFDIF